MKRWILAFVIAPVAPVLTLFLVVSLITPYTLSLKAIAAAFALSAYFGYIAYLTFGLPTLLICIILKLVRLHHSILVGAFSGTIMGASFNYFTRSVYAGRGIISDGFFVYPIFGMISALVSWVIIRPDRKLIYKNNAINKW